MADEPIVKDPNDPAQRLSRTEAMEVVQKNRMKRLYDKEIDETPQTPESVAAKAPDPDADVDLAPAAQVERQTGTPLVLSDDDLSKYMVKTKVMGEERLVPLSELRATAQKTDAADVYLREAKEKEKQARQILEDATTKAATPATPAAATPPETTVPANQAETDAMVESAVDELFRGNTDEVKALLKKVVTRPANQPSVTMPDVNQIAASVEQKVVVRSALRQFAKDYPAIYADPIARKVADDFLSEATEGKPLEAFPEEQIGKILSETGKRVVDWTRGLAGVPATGSRATTRTDKEERKAEIDELPAAATRASTEVPVPKTTSDTIAQMAANRGQHRNLPQT